MRRQGLAIVGLAALASAIYWPVRHFDFVTWDDPTYVTQNLNVLGGFTASGVNWAFTTAAAPYWHPLTWMSHMLDVTWFGVRAGGHHVTNVALHIANTLALFALLFRTTGAVGRSACVAALFAAHPLHVESVAWVAERKDLLSTFFFLLTLLAYVEYARRTSSARYAFVVGFFALGLMSKPMLVTLPFVLLLLDEWPLAAERVARPLRARLAAIAPLLLLAGGVAVATFLVQQQVGAVSAVPLGLRIANAMHSYVAYLGLTLWPARLSAFYPYPQSIGVGIWGPSLFIVLALSAIAWRWRSRAPYVLVGWLWYLITLVPVIGLVQAGDQALADRFTYVPLIGIFLIAVWGIADALASVRAVRFAGPALACAAVAVSAVTARAQVETWRNSETLWNHALAVTVNNDRAYNGLGAFLNNQHRESEAIPHFENALRINPNLADAHYNLGIALTATGRPDDAFVHYLDAVRLQPAFSEAHNNLGIAWLDRHRVDDAIREFTESLRLTPTQTQAHINLGIALLRKDDADGAVTHLMKALELDPSSVQARYRLGAALSRMGRLEDAIAQFRLVLAVTPHVAALHNDLGFALAGQQKADEAMAEYAEALRLDPALADAHNNLGFVLATQRKLDEALPHFVEAVRLRPDFEQAHVNLGLTLATQRRFDEAAREFREALRINPDNPVAKRSLDRIKGS